MFLIRFYQKHISVYTPAVCRFYPTCSTYAYTAIQRFGAFRGGLLAFKRIIKCHPFHPGGYDPVPETYPSRKNKHLSPDSEKKETPGQP